MADFQKANNSNPYKNNGGAFKGNTSTQNILVESDFGKNVKIGQQFVVTSANMGVSGAYPGNVVPGASDDVIMGGRLDVPLGTKNTDSRSDVHDIIRDRGSYYPSGYNMDGVPLGAATAFNADLVGNGGTLGDDEATNVGIMGSTKQGEFTINEGHGKTKNTTRKDYSKLTG